MIAHPSDALAVVLQTSELLFYAIKIVGAAHLLYLAIQLWRPTRRCRTNRLRPRWEYGRWRVRSFGGGG